MAKAEWDLWTNFLDWELRTSDIDIDHKPDHQIEPITKTEPVTRPASITRSQVHQGKDIYYPGWAVEKWS